MGFVNPQPSVCVCGFVDLFGFSIVGDHVILEAGDIYGGTTEPGTLTVRTQAVDQESTDSQPVSLTADLLKEVLSSNKPKVCFQTILNYNRHREMLLRYGTYITVHLRIGDE